MVKSLRWIIAVLFVFLLCVPAFWSDGQEIDLLLLPWMRLEQWPLLGVILIFFSYGVGATILIALLDRSQLTQKNRQLSKRLKLAEKELSSLRQIMAGEPDKDA